LAFFFLPGLGIALFVLIGFQNIRRRKRKKPKALPPVHLLNQQHPSKGLPHLHLLGGEDLLKAARLGESLSGFPLLAGNRLELQEDGHKSTLSMVEAIRGAKHHVHMEFYIFHADETGKLFRDVLMEKARSGVPCRLLLDHVGSFRLSHDFISGLKQAGVQFAFFNPLKLYRPWSFQLRNHRKLLIIDGELAFTGSRNIHNEHPANKKKGLSWRDTQVSLRGPIVAQLQTIFLEDWRFTSGEELKGGAYYPKIEAMGNSAVQALPSGPDETQDMLEMIVLSLIHAANDRIRIISPYLVPTEAIVIALDAAVRRGILVEFLIPARSDHRMMDFAVRGWCRDLAALGAHLYEYDREFLHAKWMTVDGRVALTGSANMDQRSFRLNFESSLLIYDRDITQKIETSFSLMQKKSLLLDTKHLKGLSPLVQVRDGLLRVVSPLL